jgi:hypothetical protein
LWAGFAVHIPVNPAQNLADPFPRCPNHAPHTAKRPN